MAGQLFGAHLLLFALPNENADHSTPERIRIAELGSFNEPLVAIQTVVMQLVGTRPSVLPNQIHLCGEVVPLKAIVARIGDYRPGVVALRSARLRRSAAHCARVSCG